MRVAKLSYSLLLLATVAVLGYRPLASAVPVASPEAGGLRIAACELGTTHANRAGASADERAVRGDAERLRKSAANSVGSAAQTPLFSRRFFEPAPDAPSVHASTIARLPDGGLIAAWFGGAREGAKDVSIYASNWIAQTESWEPPRILSDRIASGRELGRYVKKLGNPVLFCDASGRLWLYYVTVSVGGWSGASISVKHSDDQGRTWSDARRLITTPFLNLSTLVRATPIGLADGGVLLPAYHEFLYKFGELLHLDAQGQLVNKYRMNAGGDSLQPTLVPISETELLAFHRRGGKSPPYVLFNRSADGGRTWSPVRPTNLPNPGASVAAIQTRSGELLMALNPSQSNRQQLAFAISADGESWRMIEVLEAGDAGQEFSYPSLIRSDAGVYHLTYTWNRERICHVTFNDAWLEENR